MSESSSEGALKSFVMLVAWATVPAMLIGGIGAVLSDLYDWDLALGIGGSSIEIPQDRYVGVVMLGFALALAVVLKFGGVVVDFVRSHKLPFAVLGGLVLVGLIAFGGRLVEALDGGPAVSAAMKGETERVREMFELGEVDPADHGAMICWAAQNGDVDMLNLLLAEGVSPDSPRDDGTEPIGLACSFGGAEAVEVLKSAGASGDCDLPPG